MHVTMTDIMPVSLSLATHELFDARRFQRNFCDYSVLRSQDAGMSEAIWPMKKEISSSAHERKYIEGHKAVIVSNIDKILSITTSRYAAMNLRSMEVIAKDGRSIMRKVLQATGFDDIAILEPEFKSKIMLPVYELFLEYNKRSEQRGSA